MTIAFQFPVNDIKINLLSYSTAICYICHVFLINSRKEITIIASPTRTMVGLIITNSYRSMPRSHLWSGRSFPPAPCVVQFGLVGDLFGSIEEKMFLSAHSHSIWINKKYYILLYFILCNNFRVTQKHTHILIKNSKII